MDGLESKWTVKTTEIGWFKRVEMDSLQNWTVWKAKPEGLKEWWESRWFKLTRSTALKLTVQVYERLKVDAILAIE